MGAWRFFLNSNTGRRREAYPSSCVSDMAMLPFWEARPRRRRRPGQDVGGSGAVSWWFRANGGLPPARHRRRIASHTHAAGLGALDPDVRWLRARDPDAPE